MMKHFFDVKGSTGNDYTVTINITDDGKLTAGCTCKAGMNATLCKHVIGIINDNEEFSNLLHSQKYYYLYEMFLDKSAEAEILKKEAAKAKKQFSHSLMKE